MAQKEYKRRHDNLTRAIYWDLPGKCGFELNERWYGHVPDKVRLKITIINFCGTSVSEQTMKLGPGAQHDVSIQII